MKCNQCGAEVAEHNNFCTQCGNMIDTESKIQEPQSSEVKNTEQPNMEQLNTEQPNIEIIKEKTITGETINQLNINNNLEENHTENHPETSATNMDKRPKNKKPIIISGIVAILLLCIVASRIFLQNSKKVQAFDRKVKAFEE